MIDHAADAEQAGLSMPPTTVVAFENPVIGTPAMLVARDLTLDVPSRVLVRHADEAVEVVYSDSTALAARYRTTMVALSGLAPLVRIIDDALGDHRTAPRDGFGNSFITQYLVLAWFTGERSPPGPLRYAG